MAPLEIRKGPWTEQEDILLANVVSLFGDRRWDFVAKVSGLKVAGDNNRTGKSCRLRWLNYLHPGLKRGKMTAHEEHLVLELHTKWGNRWSRIARKLPGRTDNEIKNYWRTYMRKQAQEQRRAKSTSMGLSDSSSSTPTLDSLSPEMEMEMETETFYDTGRLREEFSSDDKKQAEEEIIERGYTMDDIWKCIDTKKENPSPVFQLYDALNAKGNFHYPPPVSPIWDYCSGSLLKIDNEESSISLTSVDPFQPYYGLTEAPSYESSVTTYY